MSAPRQYATFTVGGHYVGIDVLEVQEVLYQQRITPVPLAPEVIAGLLNLRGQIVPEIDLHRLLRLPPRSPDAPRFSVVVHSAEGTVSLLMDEIDDVLQVDAASFEEAPPNVRPEVRDLLTGVHKLQGRLLLVLDTSRALNVGARQRGKED
jgi:purine-binding chemotaxis protein CheW